MRDNSNSLICSIYGIYSVKASRDAEPLLIMVLRDARGPFKSFIKTTYDLKGSLHNRETYITEENMHDPNLARKDLNFLKEEKILELKNRKEFLENATKDAEFFEDLNLMDYSLLLLKLEFNDLNYKEFLKFKETREYQYYKRHIYFSSRDSKIAYICVIIDYLQDFSKVKKLENLIKNNVTERPSKNDLISCVPADIYSKRFIEFMQQITQQENK
jgi:hypothetical protein